MFTFTNAIALFLAFLFTIVLYIDYKINQTPEWIDEKLLDVIKKKKNSPIFSKLLHVFAYYVPINRLRNDTTFELFCDWKCLEKNMDVLIDEIKEQNLDIDIIIGIKSGGAIMTKYVADKLGADYDYIKISEREFNCNKTSHDSFIKKITRIKYTKDLICEDVEKCVEGKKVLILDEQVSKGKTLNTVIDYLRKKKADEIHCAVISKLKDGYPFDVIYVKEKINYCVWAWGYDN